MSLHLTIVTPERQIFDEQVDMVTATTREGEIGILPHHTDLVAQIVAGELRIKQGDHTINMATGSGLLHVTGNQVSLMTDLAEQAEHIDAEKAEEARARAKAALEEKLSDEEYAATLGVLEKSLAQLKVKRRHHSTTQLG